MAKKTHIKVRLVPEAKPDSPFYYYVKKVMTYTMVKKSPFMFPTERYLNVIKHGYKDCKLNMKYLEKALIE